MYTKNGKTYIDSFCKEIKSQNYDDPMFSLRIKAEDIAKMPVDAGWYVKLTMKKRKELGEYWQTHYLQQDDYQRQGQQSQWQALPDLPPDDLPF